MKGGAIVVSPKTEALRAIAHARALLDRMHPTNALDRKVILAALEHALDNVEAIQELKKKRRAGKVEAAVRQAIDVLPPPSGVPLEQSLDALRASGSRP